MTETELRNKMTAAAQMWQGRKEADGSHREIIDEYNRIVPLPRAYRMSYADPWCAAFVSAVAHRCGLTDIVLPECSCDAMIARYQQAGRWMENDAYAPQPGDLIFYDWQDDGQGDNQGGADHVGLVLGVGGGLISVMEGNISDAVGLRRIALNGKNIRGFALPDYAGKAQAMERADEGASPCNPPEGVSDTDENPALPAKDQERLVKVALPELQPGSYGNSVMAAQALLILHGYYCGGRRFLGHESPDGDFGEKTAQAVRNFQTLYGLEADGIIGQATWTALLRR